MSTSADAGTPSFRRASGLEYGSQYALNTPAFFGCSGAVAAVTAYKAFFEPTAMRLLVVLPMPLAFAAFVYMIMGVKEAVRKAGSTACLHIGNMQLSC